MSHYFSKEEKISNHSFVLFAMVILSDIYTKTMRIASIDVKLAIRFSALESKRMCSLVHSHIAAFGWEEQTS